MKTWNLYNNNEFLQPLNFTNGKNQEDVVKEVLESIKEGYKVIFIKGMCGTGKSAIALNIARNVGKSSIVVPGKNLQNQYKRDYESNKYLLKENGEKLKIGIITGRNNHSCKFLQDGKVRIPIVKKEVDSKLNNIFEFDKKEEKKENKDESADNRSIPCKIEIKERNLPKLKEYLRQNNNVSMKNILSVNDVKRIPVASVCPYWSPVLPEEYDPKNLDYKTKTSYQGLNGKKFTMYQRKEGCGFYKQFNYYVDSDVIVFNSLKYKLESAINRKPFTEVEIIDECDEFLDSFSNQGEINLDRLQSSMVFATYKDENVEDKFKEIGRVISEIRRDKKILDSTKTKEIFKIKETPVYELFKIFIDNSKFMDEIDDENYIFDVHEIVRMFEDFLDDSYVFFEKDENSITVNVVTTNLARKFGEMVNRNKTIVLMSGTLHSESVLKDIFGLNSFKAIEAETEQIGEINIIRTGMEKDCKYENFANGNISREEYLKSLNECVKVAKKPILVHVNAFSDLPSFEEKRNLNLHNLVTKDELKDSQIDDKENKLVEDFKAGVTEVLFTTRCARGVDFPGDECRSIIFTKYPNANPEEAFWKILKKTNPSKYWEFYKDKSRREILQKVYRGLRFKGDKIDLLSPDSRVLSFFENNKS